MLLTQTARELGIAAAPLGVYYDEVEVTDHGGHGAGRAANIEKLRENANGHLVVAVKFAFRPGSSHPSYGCERVSVTGDEYPAAALAAPPANTEEERRVKREWQP